LDSKDPGDQEILDSLPPIIDYQSSQSRQRFKDVKDVLLENGITHETNFRLVRGLDYYGFTVFEYVCSDMGAQGTILAGGRYDELLATLGGPTVPAFGWAAGLERIEGLIRPLPLQGQKSPTVVIIPVVPKDLSSNEGYNIFLLANRILMSLRDAGLEVTASFESSSLTKAMRRASREGHSLAVLVGDDESSNPSYVQLKDMQSGQQEAVPVSELASRCLSATMLSCRKD